MVNQSSIRNVAVSVDTTKAAPARVAWAASLADAFGAQLNGLAAAKPLIPAYAPFGGELVQMQPAVVQAAERQITTLLTQAETLFRANCPNETAVWKSSNACFAEAYVTAHACAADVVVLGCQNQDSDDADPLTVSPDDVILGLGRPAFIVPAGARPFSATRPLIAWKSGREARRALLDALPYLKEAEETIICAVSDDEVIPGLADAQAFLEAHDIRSTRLVESPRDRADKEALFEVAKRVDATLIVAGAYGQSRLKEWVFGGVTRGLIAGTPVPCLLSH